MIRKSDLLWTKPYRACNVEGDLLICIKVWHLRSLFFSKVVEMFKTIMQGFFVCIFQLVLYHFPRVNYGISVQIERVPPSQVKLEILVGRDRIFVDIC